MIILGLDPGPTLTAWSLLEITSSRPRYLGGGKIESECDAIAELLATERVTFASLEVIHGYDYDHVRSAALIATSRIEGLIRMAAYWLKLRILEVSAPLWRHYVCGSRTASDKHVAACVRRVVDGIPTKTNEHVRDAIGVAFCGSLMRQKAALP